MESEYRASQILASHPDDLDGQTHLEIINIKLDSRKILFWAAFFFVFFLSIYVFSLMCITFLLSHRIPMKERLFEIIRSNFFITEGGEIFREINSDVTYLDYCMLSLPPTFFNPFFINIPLNPIWLKYKWLTKYNFIYSSIGYFEKSVTWSERKNYRSVGF